MNDGSLKGHDCDADAQPLSMRHHGLVARSSPVPVFVTPMAAVSVTELPQGDEWLYELKLDGSPYFLLVIILRVTAGSINPIARTISQISA